MIYREDKKSNDLFYVCSLIEYIARKTKNKNSDIVNYLGINNINKIYDLADVYHSENIDSVCDEFIKKGKIVTGNYDNVGRCLYSVPSYWDIGKVFKRLIIMVSKNDKIPIVDALIKVYNSYVCDKINDYNSSFYYDNPQNIFNAYLYGEIE